MRIVYDRHSKIYGIEIEKLETVTIINTSDIVEAREEFIKCMTKLFNDAVCKKFED